MEHIVTCSRHPSNHVLIFLKPEAKHTAHENRISYGVGIGGFIWNGTGRDTTVLTTLYEDSKHGGNMQASLLFLNFHPKVLNTGVVPESLVISADNTPKETKNAIVYTWMMDVMCISVYTDVAHPHMLQAGGSHSQSCRPAVLTGEIGAHGQKLHL